MISEKPAKLNDPMAFISLRNFDAFQYTEAGRPRKSGERRRWARLHLSLLTSPDWIDVDANAKVVMVTLIMLATQYQNRVPNSHGYLAHVTGLSIDDVEKALTDLCGPDDRGFFYMTDDSEPEPEPEPVPRAKPHKKNPTTRFDDFWKVYPNRKDKKAALDRWQKNNLDGEADAIIAAVKRQATMDDWTKENGKYVPLPSTYLNKERWKDEATQAQRPTGELPQLDPKRLF